MEAHSGEGVEKEKFPHNRKLSHRHVSGELWNLREQHNWTKSIHTQKTHITTTTSREAAQTLTSMSSKWGLDREACAVSSVPRVRNRLECPKENLRTKTMGFPERQKKKKKIFPGKGSNAAQ